MRRLSGLPALPSLREDRSSDPQGTGLRPKHGARRAALATVERWPDPALLSRPRAAGPQDQARDRGAGSEHTNRWYEALKRIQPQVDLAGTHHRRNDRFVPNLIQLH